MIRISLTEGELALCQKASEDIYQANRNRGIVDGKVQDEFTPTHMDFLARCAEAAVMKHVGRPIRFEVAGPDDDWKKIAKDTWDIPGVAEVRSTNHATGRLLVNPGDDPQRPYVLVRTHELPVLIIVGWMPGHMAQNPKYWCDWLRRPAFLVDNTDLLTFNSG